MIEAVIFDMDGVLIDSEPFWKESEQKVFASVGVSLYPELCRQTTGFDGISTVKYWFERYPWKGKSLDQVKNEIEADVAATIEEKGTSADGVEMTLLQLRKRNIKIAVASSSPMSLIEVVTKKLNIRHYFDLLQSSESEIAGKPNPAVYLAAARRLNVNPANCLAIEDSVNGMMAAKNAGMKTVVIPDQHLAGDARYNDADMILRSLNDFKMDAFIFAKA